MKSILSQRIRAARSALFPKVTQRDVAKRLSLSPSAVNLWESGKTEPGAKELVVLACWFNVTTDWLLGVDMIQTSRIPAVKKQYDWSLLAATQDSLREHMAEVRQLREEIERNVAEDAMQRLTDVQQEMEETHTSVDNEYTPVEPVAWRWPTHNGYAYSETHSAGEGGQPLYTAPPQRKPLTDEEIDRVWRSVDYKISYDNFRLAIARAIERAHDIGGEE